MHVISMKKLREFWEEHPDAEVPLRVWYRLAEKAAWGNFVDLKRTAANTADQVGQCTIFNIHGHRYRLIVKVDYEWGKVFIKHVLTHKEDDRGLWRLGCQESRKPSRTRSPRTKGDR